MYINSVSRDGAGLNSVAYQSLLSWTILIVSMQLCTSCNDP